MKSINEKAAFSINDVNVSKQTADQLLSQTQYYFSPLNLITDTFLRNIIKCNYGGWVKIDVLLSFNKIR